MDDLFEQGWIIKITHAYTATYIYVGSHTVFILLICLCCRLQSIRIEVNNEL